MFVGLCMCVCMCKFIYVCIEGEGGGERERERKQARDSFCTCMYIHPDIHTQQCVYIYIHTDVFAVFVSYRTISICMTRYRMHLYAHKTFSLQPRSSDFEA